MEFRRRLGITRETMLRVILRDGYLEVRPLHLEGVEGPPGLLAEVEGMVREDQLDEATAQRIRQIFGETSPES